MLPHEEDTLPDWARTAIYLTDTYIEDASRSEKAMLRKLPPLRIEGSDKPLPLKCSQGLMVLCFMAPYSYEPPTDSRLFAQLEPFKQLDMQSARELARFVSLYAFSSPAIESFYALHFMTRFPDLDLIKELLAILPVKSTTYDGTPKNDILIALAHVDHPLALYHIHRIARSRAGYLWAQEGHNALSQACKRLCVTPRELFYMGMPTLGLDAQGTRTLDYGARSIEMRACPLSFVDSQSHKTYASLPRPKKKGEDQAELFMDELRSEIKHWRGAKKQLLDQMQRDWLTFQSWRPEFMTSHMLTHPLLLRETCMTLLWQATLHDDRTALVVFNEEAEALTLGMTPLDLSRVRTYRIALAHEIDAHTRARWVEYFVDFDIIQPFDQLDTTRASFIGQSAAILDEVQTYGMLYVNTPQLIETLTPAQLNECMAREELRLQVTPELTCTILPYWNGLRFNSIMDDIRRHTLVGDFRLDRPEEELVSMSELDEHELYALLGVLHPYLTPFASF